MKKRLRKKKRVGEYKEFGFELIAELGAKASEAEVDAFVVRLVDVIDERRLAFGGGVSAEGTFGAFITKLGRGSATEEDREALRVFCEADKGVQKHGIGDLRDAWYGWK